MNRYLKTVAVAAVLSLASSVGAQGSLFEALAGPGEKVMLTTGESASGDRGTMKTFTNSDGSFDRFEAVGAVNLESPKINLSAESLVYNGAEGTLLAEGDVDMEQPGVSATCRKLTYYISTGEIRLSGNPKVNQATEGGSTRFDGMDNFVYVAKESGGAEIRLLGGKEIVCESVTTPPSPGAKPSADTEPAEGLGALGSNVTITVRPLGSKEPLVLVNTSEQGGFGLFRAEGSVIFDSEEMNLRSDQLEFDSARQLVEALYNVYIKQGNIEADCGRMLYDLVENHITLSVDPFVRERRRDGIVNISEMDRFIIVQNEDGSTSTEAIGGPDGNPKFVYESVQEERAMDQPRDNSPREIRLEDVDSLNRIGE